MIAVLVDSRRKGASRWVAVRHSREVILSGLSPLDSIELYGRNGSDEAHFALLVDGAEGTRVVPLDEEIEFVKACHVEAGPESRVFIDLR